jgi:hypothetical protein
MMAEPQHGTYAGWNWHMKNGVQTCAACRKAQAEYQAARRRANPAIYEKEKTADAARAAALWRLATFHPSQFQALVAQERAARGLDADTSRGQGNAA